MSAPQRRWTARVPDVLWAPLAGGGLMLLVGLLGLAAHQPWLFPSLGPTAFLQVEAPNLPTSRLYNTVVGHALGLSIGMLAVVLLGAQHAPSVLASHQLTLPRVIAAVLAVMGTLLLGLLLRASHPPAAATTLLVALGGFGVTVDDALTVVVGVLIVALLGEGLRRLRVDVAE